MRKKILFFSMTGVNAISLSLLLTFLILFSAPTLAEWGGEQGWMNLIRQDCSPTIKGRAKKLISEKSYWVEVNVSMDLWIQDMRVSQYEKYCDAFSRSPETLMSCLASIKHDIDWFGRCKNQIVYMCRSAGGLCN